MSLRGQRIRVLGAVLTAIALAGVAAAIEPVRAAPATRPLPEPADPPPMTSPLAAAPGDEAPELMLFKDIPVVVAAGKREQTEQQAAASVSVVAADDIELFNYHNLAEVLRDQRSFYLQTDGLNWFAGVRGFLRPGEWNARLLVLVDGRPTRETIFSQTHLDQDFVVPMEAVKRVEIVRGPGSTLYGSNAVFGVINVVTKDGGDLNGVQFKLEGGTQNTARGSLMVGTRTKDGWDVLAGASGYLSQGTKDIIYSGVTDAAHNYGHIRDFDSESADTLFLKVHKGDFTAQFDLETRNRDNRSATYLARFDDPGAMHEDRANVTFRVDHEIAPGRSFHAMAYYSHYLYDQTYPLTNDATGLPYRYISFAADDWIGGEFHFDWQLGKTLRLVTGAELTQALYTHQRDHDDLHGIVTNSDLSFSSYGLFAEGEWKPVQSLTVTLGVRYDGVQRVGTNVNPRAAAVWSPTKSDTLKLLYGRAFRAPNLYEMFYSSPGFNVPNLSLRPEVVDTYEAVWERQFAGGWRASLDGFFWQMTDALDDVTLPDGSQQVQNTGHRWAHGVEAEIARRWDNGARARGYVTWTQATGPGSQRLPFSPEWIVGLAVAVPLWDRNTFLSVEPQFVAPMTSQTGKYVGATYATNIVFTARDVAKVHGLQLQAGVYGLFANSARWPSFGEGVHYQPTLNYPQTRFLVGLSYRF